MSDNEKQEGAKPSINGHVAEAPFEAIRKQITGFGELKRGWDTYGAGAPSHEAISRAVLVLDELEEMKLDVTLEWAVPTGDESILLQYLIADTIYHWQFNSDGDIAVMEKPAGGEPVYLDVDPSEIAEVSQGFAHAGTQ